MNFAQKLKDLRTEKNLTQEELANALREQHIVVTQAWRDAPSHKKIL